MPVVNIILSPGEIIPDNYKYISDLFNAKDLRKLEKLGGRIQISLTAPYSDKKTKNTNQVIDDQYISTLQDDPELTKEKISLFDKKQLLLLAKLLEMSIASKWTRKELQNKIVQHVNAPNQWKRIAGTPDN